MSKEDMELLEIFNGEEKPLHPNTVHMTLGDYQKATTGTEKKITANTTRAQKTVQKPKDKPANENKTVEDAKWEPVKPAPNWLDNLKACAKWTAGFGGLCLLLFYWQQTGQMEPSAAVPSMCVCTALAGFGIGKNAVRGNRK